MGLSFSLEEAVRARYSVRTFSEQPVEAEKIELIRDYARILSNPLGPSPKLHFLDTKTVTSDEPLGTKGFIRGATVFLGAAIERVLPAQEALGYELEHLILYITSLGLGTCWLGETFTRGSFARAMGLRREELFPVITPIGYAAAEMSEQEKKIRETIHADERHPWEDMYYFEDFGTALTTEEAGDFAWPLEMLRWAPSAMNNQQWRVLFTEKALHFYLINPNTRVSVDMHRVDMGIAICHFDLAAQEMQLAGRIAVEASLAPAAPDNLVYIASWFRE